MLTNEEEATDERRALDALAAIADALDEPGEVATVAERLVECACAVLGLKHGEAYLEDGAPVKAMAGRDAAAKPTGQAPGASGAAAFVQGSSIVIPLLAGKRILGRVVLDAGMDGRILRDEELEHAASIGRIGGGALLAVRRRTQLDAALRQRLLLRRASTLEHRLSQVLHDGGGVHALIGWVAELTGMPVALYDDQLLLAAACGFDSIAGGCPDRLLKDTPSRNVIVDRLAEVLPGATTMIAPTEGSSRRRLLAPVDVRAERSGWIMLLEHSRRIGSFDELAAQRASRYVALELLAERRESVTAWDERSLLARQLIRGTQHDDVLRAARHLGVELDATRVVAFLAVASPEGDVDASRLIDCLRQRLAGELMATTGPQGVAVLIDVPDGEPPLSSIPRIKRALEETYKHLGVEAIAALSSVCRGPQAVPRGYREAREVARCIEHTGSHRRVLAADDLGPGRLLLSQTDASAVQAFVEDVLGPLLGDDSGRELLRTLEVFFATRRNIRQSAAVLRIHENTVRYRLRRVRDIVGLDVSASAEDQLSVQVALLVLRLQCHPALGAFDGVNPATRERSVTDISSVAA